MPPLTDKAASFARTETEEGKPMTAVPEMIERVARAMCREDGDNPDMRAASFDGGGPRALWTFRVSHARAAVAAMREPTGAVVEAVENVAEDRYRAAPKMLRWHGEEVWNAGIDAALGNPQVAE